MPVEINYAINGTVNYLTLDPTLTNKFAGNVADDKWGGVSAGFKMTGQTENHKIGYAAGYVTDGAPGPLKNFTFSTSAIPLYGNSGLAVGPTGNLTVYNVNSGPATQVIGGSPLGEGPPPAACHRTAVWETFAEPLVGCCYQTDTGYHSTSELGEARLQLLE